MILTRNTPIPLPEFYQRDAIHIKMRPDAITTQPQTKFTGIPIDPGAREGSANPCVMSRSPIRLNRVPISCLKSKFMNGIHKIYAMV